MRVGSATLRLRSQDDDLRRRERAESQRLIHAAAATGAQMDAVTARMRRMNALYRERLIGSREPVK